jgi:hypothetical protein
MSRRLCVCMLAVVVVPSWASAAATTATETYPGTRLTSVAGVAVFVSSFGQQRPAAVCPREPRPLTAALLRQAAAAVAQAMPAFYRHAAKPGSPRIDARDARATAGPAAAAGTGTSLAGFCGATVWRRSAYVAVRLPRVRFSASLSRPSFEVARTPLGWVIWAEIH